MAEAKKRLLTYAGLKALEDELENLKVVKRKEVAGKIKEAREQCVGRYAGYFLGKRYQKLGRRQILKCTMSPYYWKRIWSEK